MTRIVTFGSGLGTSIALRVADIARDRGHEVSMVTEYADDDSVRRALIGADAAVLIPRRGNAWRNAAQPIRALIAASADLPVPAHLVLLSSFAVGHGIAHPLNRTDANLLPGRVEAERALRSSGLPYTIVRPTWLTEDPAGSHSVVFTQDPHTDGMLSRADLAAVLVAAVEHSAARGTTFALFNQPGTAPTDWAASFAALRHDTPARTEEEVSS